MLLSVANPAKKKSDKFFEKKQQHNFKAGLGCFAMIVLFSRGRGKFNYGKLMRLTSFKGNSICFHKKFKDRGETKL